MKKMIGFLLFIGMFFAFAANAKTVILFTGLPCSGKSTISESLHDLLPNSVILDADEVRKTINNDLSFTKEDREENLRRVTQMAILLSRTSSLVILNFVSPYDSVRERMKKEIEQAGVNFYEIFVKASVDECIKRDVKGMYKKALAGEIPVFTGISAPYEEPKNPDLICDTEKNNLEECTAKVISLLGLVHPHTPHAVFIGRWSPFHKGHLKIMQSVYEENKNRPLLVLVRDRTGEHWSATKRKKMVEAGLKNMNIPATVRIIPDIDSVNWGRGVGYTPRMVDVDVSMHAISGTKIRELIQNNDNSFKDFLCPGVANVILEIE